jgi:iron complex outermembrane receptor protein
MSMMKKLFLAICFIFLNVVTFAQFTSTVTDAVSGNPLPSATISVDGREHFITDENGIASFRLTPGTHTIKVSSVGYKSRTVVTEAGKAPVSISLERFNLFLQPVEIRATRASEHSPFTKTNLDQSEIDKNNLGQDLPFLLNQLPSVVISSDAGNGIGYTGIRIRGTDATRINMTLNGIPYNDAESQGIFFVNLPDFSSSVNSIQVQRGVGTSSNGAGAFGATLNLSTNEFNEHAYAEVNNTVGSYNTWKHTVKAGTGLIDDHFTIDTRLSKITSDGFIDRGSSDLRSFFISGAYYSPQSSLRLNIFSGKERTYQAWNGIPQYKLFYNADSLLQHYYNNIGSLYFTAADSVNLFSSDPRRYNVFTYPGQTDNYQQDHYQLLFNHSFASDFSFNSAVFLTKGKGYYEEYKNQAKFSSYGLPDFSAGNKTFSETDLIRQLWLDNQLYGGIFSFLYKSNSSEGTLGGGINQYDGKHKGYVTWAEMGFPANYQWYYYKAGKTDFNIYGKWEQKLSTGLQAIADLQLRTVHYHMNGSRKFPDLRVDETFHFFNPKIGISYTKGAFSSYISYAIGNKEPNRTDYETGAGEKPKPERLRDLEAGIGQSAQRYSWNSTFFFMNYKDQLVLSGKINDVGDPVRINVPSSYRLGWELEGSYHPSTLISVSGNIALSENKIKNFYDNLPRYDVNFDLVNQDSIFYKSTEMALSPSVVAAATVSLFPLKYGEIDFINKYSGKQYLDNSSSDLRKINPYFVSDLRLSYSIMNRLIKELKLVLQVNNLFNKKYESNGYTYSYVYDKSMVTENFYYPMAGRNVLFALNLGF